MFNGEVQGGYRRLYTEAMYYSRPMGLDAVEIVLRVEELFGIEISDDQAASVRTVGAVYELICAKLNVVPLASPVTSKELPTITQREAVPLLRPPHASPSPSGSIGM